MKCWLFFLICLFLIAPAFGQRPEIWPPWCYESGSLCCCGYLPPIPPSTISNCLFEMRECCETCYKPEREDGMAPSDGPPQVESRTQESSTPEQKTNVTVCGILRKDAPPVAGADFERNLKRLSKLMTEGANQRAALVNWGQYPATTMTFDRFEVWKMGVTAHLIGTSPPPGFKEPPVPDGRDTLWDAVLFVIAPESYANIRKLRQ